MENNSHIKMENGIMKIIGSDNIVDKKIGDILNINDEKINTRGPFPARIFNLSESIYNDISNLNYSLKDNNKEDNLNNIDSNIFNNPEPEITFEKSIEQIGQYAPNTNFKPILAKGVMRETIACLQMLANELNLPYRSDAIEKILRDSIKRGNNPTIQLLGGITSMMGLHSSGARLKPDAANRLPSPAIIAWGDSFALVKDSRPDTLEIVSPKEGIIYLKSEQFEESFTKGFIELLVVEKNEQTPEKKFGIEWLLPSINRYRGVLLQVVRAPHSHARLY